MKMKIITIGTDPYRKRDIRKIIYSPEEIPKVQLFSGTDVIMGNPASNLAVGIIYTWRTDKPPAEVSEFAVKISNYAAMTGFWRTTNGAKYVFANILANPNINKLILLVFDAKDNGHLLADALVSFWKEGVDRNGIIKGSRAANPKSEQVTHEALQRVREQCDLLVVRRAEEPLVLDILEHAIDTPERGMPADGLEIYSFSKTGMLYDDGIRFEEPYYLDLSGTSKQVVYEKKELSKTLGQAVHAKDLSDAIEMISAFVFMNGSMLRDQRNILTCENRSLTLAIEDPLRTIPAGFSKEYISKYVGEFMEGHGEEFAYTYHDRIFNRWGDQPARVAALLKNNPSTRRALISLWDQEKDLGNENAPCLIFIWFVIREKKLEAHVVYRSHHLATVTKDGKLMQGEGALVPNLYAVATLQRSIADRVSLQTGYLVLTDLSGHVYVSEV